MKSRRSGNIEYIQIHLELDGELKLNQAHKIGDALVDKIRQRYPRAEVIIHHDPVTIA